MNETGMNETGMNETGMSQGAGRGKAAAWHPIPTWLVDEVMPRLRDTELRVLLVVVRQTLGWQEGPGPMQRKERDWLTQSQLMRRTGRASEAVARAVDALVRDGLIEVLDRAGSALGTPAERRRHLGRLYYRLSPQFSLTAGRDQGTGLSESEAEVPKSEHAEANTTKESRYKNISRNKKIVEKPVENPLVIRGGWSKAGADTSSIPFLSRSRLCDPKQQSDGNKQEVKLNEVKLNETT